MLWPQNRPQWYCYTGTLSHKHTNAQALYECKQCARPAVIENLKMKMKSMQRTNKNNCISIDIRKSSSNIWGQTELHKLMKFFLHSLLHTTAQHSLTHLPQIFGLNWKYNKDFHMFCAECPNEYAIAIYSVVTEGFFGGVQNIPNMNEVHIADVKCKCKWKRFMVTIIITIIWATESSCICNCGAVSFPNAMD